MTTPARLPGTALAVGAFCLTFLLGIGTTSAIALWQQSSTATMTVKYGTSAPSVSLSCGYGSGPGNVVLTVTPSETVNSLSYNARRVGQSYPIAETSLSPSTTSFTVSLTTPAITATGIGNRDVNVRVTAGFQSSTATAEVLVRIRGGGGAYSLTCG